MRHIRLYFYLAGSYPSPIWTSKIEKVNKLNNLGSVNWKVNEEEKVIVDLMVDDYNMNNLINGQSFYNKYDQFKFKTVFTLRHLPILKSQIQKCVRRLKVDIGLRTAISMVLIEDSKQSIKQIGLFELLRRLTIIMIEDSVLCESYSYLMWCMSVLTKGHYLNAICIEKILELTKGILSSGFQDPGSYKPNKFKVNIFDLVKQSINKPMILSVLFRSCYKGMSCDHLMLLDSSHQWSARYHHCSPLIKYTNINLFVPIEEFNQLTKEDIQTESLDHHCTDIIERIKKYIEMEKSEIGKLIWENESCVNLRFNIETDKLFKLSDKNKKGWFPLKFVHKLETNKLMYEI
jgi:hypothetical protein